MSTFLRYPKDVDLAIFHNNLWIFENESLMAESTWLFLPIDPKLPSKGDEFTPVGSYGTVIMTSYTGQTVQDAFLWSVTPEGQLKILAVDSEYENDLFAIKLLSLQELIILRTTVNGQSEMVLRKMNPPDRVVINSDS